VNMAVLGDLSGAHHSVCRAHQVEEARPVKPSSVRRSRSTLGGKSGKDDGFDASNKFVE
jgi:hypothetical protein